MTITLQGLLKMNTYDSTFYKLVVTPFAVDVQPKFDEYKFNNLDDINYRLQSCIEFPILNDPRGIQYMISEYNSIFEWHYSMGNITPIPKTASDIRFAELTQSAKAYDKEKYERAVSRTIKMLNDDFEITNEHDQKFIANKLSNHYSKYGELYDIRVCYSDESGSSDRMFKYIKRNGRYTAFQKLYHNEVTNNYMLVGFDFKDIG